MFQDELIAGYQCSILDLLAASAPRALPVEVVEKTLKLPHRVALDAIRHLRNRIEVFQFDVDGVPHYCRYEDRGITYVEHGVASKLDGLYSVFGTSLPPTIRRTPTFNPTGDLEDVTPYNRYRELELTNASV